MPSEWAKTRNGRTNVISVVDDKASHYRINVLVVVMSLLLFEKGNRAGVAAISTTSTEFRTLKEIFLMSKKAAYKLPCC